MHEQTIPSVRKKVNGSPALVKLLEFLYTFRFTKCAKFDVQKRLPFDYLEAQITGLIKLRRMSKI